MCSLRTGLAILAISYNTLTLAQITPGQVDETLKKAPELKAPPAAAPIEQQQRKAPTEARGEGIKITINRFIFAGNTVYSSEALGDLVKNFTNRPLTLNEIYEAADVVADYYIKNGFGLASVNVPAQKVSSGEIKLDVIEGRLSRITVENTGNSRHDTSNLLGFLGDVQPGTIYRGETLQDGMRRLNDIPGLKAKAIVKPGDQYGTSDIVVKTVETPIAGSLTLDNYGRKQIGEYRATALAQFNNPFGVEDQLTLLALRSQRSLLRYYYAAYGVPMNYYGTRLNIAYGRADFDVDGVPVSGYSNNTKLSLQHPLIRSSTDTLDITAGVNRISSTSLFGSPGVEIPGSGTSITLFEIGGSFNHVYESQAVSQLTTTLSTDFKKQDPAKIGVDRVGDQRLRIEFDAQHLQPLFARMFLLGKFNTVYSPDALHDSQKYSIGGPQNVRGFPASETRGDRGYFASLTLTRSFNAGPVTFTPRVFADTGKVSNRRTSPTTTQPIPQTLSSAGVGLDTSYSLVNLKLDWSRPLGAVASSDGRDESRLFGSFAVTFP